ncbi:MAG: polymer-forming cytoskeletal protein [Acidobacteria bacterium]|nr:polymer-forming cytoskeletal protein [Acidobacteriota bacterium]
MWNRRDEPASRQTPTGPSPQPAAAPAPATPQPAPLTADAHRGATIGKAVKVVGDIYSEEDLYLDGEVEGTIELRDHRLIVGANGKAKSAIKARDVIVSGSVQGNVECSHKITIRKDGKLVGDIKTAGIIIDDEAYFKGSIDIVRNGSGD